jgi:putative aminopeptidase FrvX
MGYAQQTDPAGNIQVKIPSKNPNAPLFVFASHMDEIGMVISGIQEDGKLQVVPSGGLHPWKLGEGAVDIFGDHQTLKGILSMGSTHTSEAEKKTITWKDVLILSGLTPSEILSAGIRPGTPVLPTRERRGPVIFGPSHDPLVGAWTFDDRMGCVTLLRLLKSIKDTGIQPFHPIIIAFTTREEIGGHGAKFRARSTNPEVFIAVDGTPMRPGIDLKLDGRPGIWVKDRIAQYDQELYRAFDKAALDAGTQLQPVVLSSAASDASLVSYALGVPRIGCIGHVRENSHGYEVARLSVFDNLLNTLLFFLKSYQGG